LPPSPQGASWALSSGFDQITICVLFAKELLVQGAKVSAANPGNTGTDLDHHQAVDAVAGQADCPPTRGRITTPGSFQRPTTSS